MEITKRNVFLLAAKHFKFGLWRRNFFEDSGREVLLVMLTLPQRWIFLRKEEPGLLDDFFILFWGPCRNITNQEPGGAGVSCRAIFGVCAEILIFRRNIHLWWTRWPTPPLNIVSFILMMRASSILFSSDRTSYSDGILYKIQYRSSAGNFLRFLSFMPAYIDFNHLCQYTEIFFLIDNDIVIDIWLI